MSLDANSCAYVALYRWSVRSLAGGGQASPWRSLIAVGLTAGARRGIRPDMPRLFRVDNRAARFNPSNVEPRRWVMAGRVTCSDEQENAEQWRNQYGAKGAKWSRNYQRRFLLIKQIEVFGWQSSAACSANPNVNAETATHPCGRLSWLPVSFLLHVKYTLSYRIVHLQWTKMHLDCLIYSASRCWHECRTFTPPRNIPAEQFPTTICLPTEDSSHWLLKWKFENWH